MDSSQTPDEKKQTEGTSSAGQIYQGGQMRRRLSAEIDTKWTDLLLLVCFLCAGIIDSMAFALYGCFVSMQTGNTIFVSLGASGQPESSPPYSWSKSLLAIICFALGALSFAAFHRKFGPTKRWVLMCSFLVQAAMIALVACIVTAGLIANKPEAIILSTEGDFIIQKIRASFPRTDFAPIAILAFQSAGQIVASRVLKFNSMPTVVLTSLYCDLMSDANLFTARPLDNADRNRRVSGAASLFLGAVAGGFLAKSWVGFSGGLWIAAFLKFCIVLGCFLWNEKPKK